MPQLHLYLSEALADDAKRQADSEGTSVSQYLARIVRRELERDWPRGYFDEVVGAWEGDPLERPSQPAIEARLELD